MDQTALALAVKSMNIPEQTVRALFENYLDFLKQSNAGSFQSLETRLVREAGFFDKCLAQAKQSMIASTLMLTLSAQIDFEALAKAAFEPAGLDKDLLALKAELVSRSLSMNKDIPGLCSLGKQTVNARKKFFCEY